MEHLFPDRKGRNVCWSNGGETCGREPSVSGSLVENRDQMVEISTGWVGRNRGWSSVFQGATLVGGHVWR